VLAAAIGTGRDFGGRSKNGWVYLHANTCNASPRHIVDRRMNSN
jgi:hypothetical protein